MFHSDLPEDRHPVIVAARRSPIGRAFGALSEIEPQDLAASVLRAALADSGAEAEEVDDVILGNATGGGGNIARLSALSAGLPVSVPGVTLDRQCGSGLDAIVTACHLVAAGAGTLYLAGGVESTSRAPWRVARPRRPGDLPSFFGRARFAPDDIGDPEMGVAAENVARRYGISRARQDALALQSHRRAVASQADGLFDAETVSITTPGGVVSRDECPRADTSADRLAALPPVFADDGTVTAGNACPLNDGASVVVVTSLAQARRLGRRRGLRFAGAATAGVAPGILGIGPVPATRKLLTKHPDLSLDDASIIEFNEAFAAQVLASLDELGLAADCINRDGGALALGHPFGASGALLVTRIFHQFQRSGGRHPDGALAFATMGIGGGMGQTAAFRNLAIG
ncbi:thiolase family protein [Thalassococcus sp. BH17M4-6]|uniref:thiolase family protein n=1 Tax=Thalassococcus sp. BH17M4-6 TaxID=3413148 RepID=UPI003BC5104A